MFTARPSERTPQEGVVEGIVIRDWGEPFYDLTNWSVEVLHLERALLPRHSAASAKRMILVRYSPALQAYVATGARVKSALLLLLYPLAAAKGASRGQGEGRDLDALPSFFASSAASGW